MNTYRYSLDKSSQKFICPSCGRKTFVKYVDNHNNSFLESPIGRCDRENKCGTHNKPYCNKKIAIQVRPSSKTKPSYHSLELLQKSVLDQNQNNFIDFVKQIFSKDEVDEAVLKYFIGTSKKFKNSTIFWQIDNEENVHAGKIMLYDRKTGKRFKSKDGRSHIRWVHNINSHEKFQLEQCLFGLHLIIETTQKTLAVVESEKTAVIMSIIKPEYIWLATCSKQGFKKEMLEPIKTFKIVAFPDKGEFDDWQEKAIKLNRIGFKIIVNQWLEQIDCAPGTDLADIIINQTQLQ